MTSRRRPTGTRSPLTDRLSLAAVRPAVGTRTAMTDGPRTVMTPAPVRR
ncbi:hypothetical protein ACFWPV_06190 [Streptomyces uncialis]